VDCDSSVPIASASAFSLSRDMRNLALIVGEPLLPVRLGAHGDGAGPAPRHPHVRFYQDGEAERVGFADRGTQFVVVHVAAANKIRTGRVGLPEEWNDRDRGGADTLRFGKRQSGRRTAKRIRGSRNDIKAI
jgi:hypothetical protein